MSDKTPLPCPFCGKEPEIVKIENYGRDDWYITCKPLCIEQKHLYSSKAAAIKAWNRRASDENIQNAI